MRIAYQGLCILKEQNNKSLQALRLACLVLIMTSIALLAVVIIITIIQEQWEGFNEKLLYMGVVFLGTSASILACIIARTENNVRISAHGGIISGLIAIPLWMIVVWRNWQLYYDFDILWRLTISITLIMIACTAFSQLLSLKTRFVILSIASYLVGVLWFACFGMIILMIFEILPVENPTGGGPSLLVITTVVPSLIAAIAGTIILTTVIRIAEKRAVINAETIPAKIQLKFTCPKCEYWQSLPTGPGSCANCKALLVIEIEEPRCECGYLLYQLISSNCPECGRQIPDDQQWLTASQ